MKSAVSIQVLPLNTENKEQLYSYVDQAIAIIEESGLSYTVGPFETTVEGELEEVWEIAGKAHKAVLKAGAAKVISYIKLASGDEMGTTAEKISKYKTGEEDNAKRKN